MVDVLSTLLNRSWAFYKANFTAILLGALVSGAVTLALQLTISQQASQGMETIGIDTNRLEELQKRAQAGDQQAAQEMQREIEQTVGKLNANGGVSAFVGNTLFNVFKDALWTLLVGTVVSVVLGILFHGYILILVLEKQTPQLALSKLGTVLVPLVGLSVWLIIRSFIWVPFIGIIIAIVLSPRFILAPIYLIRDRKGVMESATLSYAQTQGYWGKIAGNSVVAGICAVVVAWAVNLLLRIVLAGYASYLAPFVSALAIGFTFVFAAYLGLALLQGRSTSTPMSSAAPATPVS